MAYEYVSWAYGQEIPGAGRKFVLVALADSANADGYSFPGQKRLAAMTGQSERTIRQHLEWLEEHGYVRREERRRKDGTRTSDAYYLPPMDSTGSIRRLSPSGKSRRLMQGQENPDQDDATPTSPSGKSRRLSAPRSTGNLRRGHRQNSPVDAKPTSDPSSTAQTPAYQPADFAGHEPINHQKEPSASSTGSQSTRGREEAAENLNQKPPGVTAEAKSLPTTHPETFKALGTFRELHGPKANAHMFKAWTTAVVMDINQHGELAVLESLAAAINNFPSLEYPFAFYRACLRQTGAKPAGNNPRAPKEAEPALDPDDITRLINEAKEGTLT